MLRQDSERKNQAIKQAEKDKKVLHKQLIDINARYEQASAGLVQLTQQTATMKTQESTEKTRLKAQKEKLENLCRVLRAENTKLKESAGGNAVPEQQDSEKAAVEAVSSTALPEDSPDTVQQKSQADTVNSDTTAHQVNN